MSLLLDSMFNLGKQKQRECVLLTQGCQSQELATETKTRAHLKSVCSQLPHCKCVCLTIMHPKKTQIGGWMGMAALL